MLLGKTVGLRSLQKSDIDWLYTVENDSEWWHLSQTTLPHTHQSLEQLIADAAFGLYANKQHRFVVVRLDNNEPIGFWDVFDYDPLAQRAGLGVQIFGNNNMRKGFAADAFGALKKHLFLNLRLNQVYVQVHTNNQNALELFKKLGFEIAGLLKQWTYWNGDYQDVYILQLMKENIDEF